MPKETRMTVGRRLAIVNPAAKHGATGRQLPAIKELLGAGQDVEILASDRPEHAREIAASAEGFDTILAVGGDGTVHEVLNGLMARDQSARPALGVIPTGSGNDYARTLGVSFDLSTAVRQVMSGVAERVDIGIVNDVYFANSAAIGLDARVTAKAVDMKVSTGWSGLPLYLRSLFYVLFNQFYSHPVTLQFDDEDPHERTLLLIAMTNGPTYGGGFFITPTAVRDDGLLDVCVFDEVTLFGALWRLPFVIVGRHEGMRPVHMSRHARVRLWSERPIEGQIDGEVTLSTHYDVRVLPQALTVIVPRPAT